MAKIDKEYHNLLDKILQEGYKYEDPNRKGVKRLEIPSYTFRHEFKDGFPAITTKKLHYKNVVTELLWFLKGDTNIKYLIDNGCNIWNKDAYNYYLKQFNNSLLKPLSYNNFIEFIKNEIDKNEIDKKEWDFNINNNNYNCGDLGPVYGKQWRDFNRIDQIKNLIQGLKDKPLGTEHIVNTWNVGDLENMALPPCHYGFQVVVRPLPVDKKANPNTIKYFQDNNYLPKYGFELHWHQRSVDTFLGLAFNIASYATLALILEKITGYKALAIQGDLKKVHLYDNSLNAVKEQLSRDIDKYSNCKLQGADLTELMDEFDDKPFNLDYFVSELEPELFKLENYESYPYIKVEMLERNK